MQFTAFWLNKGKRYSILNSGGEKNIYIMNLKKLDKLEMKNYINLWFI